MYVFMYLMVILTSLDMSCSPGEPASPAAAKAAAAAAGPGNMAPG